MEAEAEKQILDFKNAIDELEIKFNDRLPVEQMKNIGKLHLHEYCYIGGNLTIQPDIFDSVITEAMQSVFQRFY